METAHHLLVDCRYTCRLWIEVARWLGLPELRPATWPPSSSPLGWWTVTPSRHNISQKAFRSLALLISWELWKERNSRIFNRSESPITTLVSKIKGRIFSLALRRRKVPSDPERFLVKVVKVFFFPASRVFSSSLSMKLAHSRARSFKKNSKSNSNNLSISFLLGKI
jgi:hypothetical protein